ncbi:SulP family inorganic anion transporter [Fulvivirgaceae bacterium BMA10]|uniref:SulP family inorganic anion transporter n=2 Tax=Splendidivirga corallicola TaxID=3051826 RepID=A0ABT8KNV7_9BACT|nr:SulP family inorganic anion transporter [Fulvivirgaceae bacterium BMA10]
MKSSKYKTKNFFSNVKQDLPASIVVFFVAVPLCLGIALASGAPLFSGLIAGIVGGIVVGALSNSPLGVSGPAAGLAVIVLASIQSLGAFEIFLVAVVLAGIIQVVLGLLKGGIIGYYFPSSVIKGMLAGIGIIIFLKQIPHAFGYDVDYEGDLSFQQLNGENTFSELINMLDYISPGAVIVSIISLTILLTWDLYFSHKHKVFKLVQGPLVAVAMGIVYQLVTSAFFPAYTIESQHLVSVPVAESFSGFLNQFTFPDFSYVLSSEVWVVALTIAVVASLETLLCVEATDKLDPQKRVTNTNRELFAQGGGNILSGLIGGLPITQVIVRSSANVQSGGQTRLSSILHGMFLLICVALIPAVLNMIPLAVLACILFVVGYKLAKPSLFKHMYKLGWDQFAPFVITILGIVFTDLLKGIAMGFIVSLVILLRNSFKNSHFLHKEVINNGRKKVKMTLAEEVTFINKGAILKALNNLPAGTQLTIDMSKSVGIDYDVLEIIDNYKNTSGNKGIEVKLVNRGDLQTADY